MMFTVTTFADACQQSDAVGWPVVVVLLTLFAVAAFIFWAATR